MIVYVHAHNIWDRGVTFGRHAGVHDVLHITVPADETMAEAAARVIEAVEHERAIWLLILNGHGSPGHVYLGAGLNEVSVYDLAPLRAYMTPGGRGVEVHACQVAADATPYAELACDPYGGDEPRPIVGLEVLRRLAHVLDCEVRASSQLQIGYQEIEVLGRRFANPRGDGWGRFEGDLVLVYPNGSFTLTRL